ncbi:MAG: hypothetical protein CVU88_02670 [Firmicutes bacterium HGW-Firmicutes-13]|nr:MAG: hypothetical protein CVU88_02670 [Firmicutes bacterium HGW-Firmicutes-13]
MSILTRLFKLIKNEKGSVIIIAAVAMTTILGFTALVTDIGLIYLNRVNLMNTADSAALAGAQRMAESDQFSAESTARQYVTLNDNTLPPENIDVNINTNDKTATVTLNKEVAMCFARVLNIYTSNVTAKAKATYEYPTAISQVKNGNIFPLFLSKNIYDKTLKEDGFIDESVVIGLMGSDNKHVKINDSQIEGNWGGLYFGEDEFTAALEGTLTKKLTLKAGTWYEEGTKPGSMGGEVADAVNYRLDPKNGIKSYGLIPIIDKVEEKQGGKVKVHIAGFAVYQILGVEKTPPGYTIYGHLLNNKSISDFFGETSSDEIYNYGSHVYMLIE